ncbi:DUF4340 domain-containing protein [Marispirochaeta aestuarii]|uniref:DUF4340 domain-containing protein n=1 Tax=Marispirochaeta aestuarii TaxID=1963862 RepID=UPI0029C91C0A|nr:DUF4340 domain-containing protein [Marispirochaeta aestuarii]
MSRSRRLVIALLVLLLLLGSYLYLKKKAVTQEPRREAEQHDLISRAAEDLEKIEVLRADGSSLVLMKEEERWVLPVPWKDELDQSRLDLVARISSILFANRCLEKSAAGLDDFGLKPPRAVVTLVFRGGGSSVFDLGYPTPSGKQRYIRPENAEAIYTIDNTQVAQFFLNQEDFRNTIIPTVNAEELRYLFFRRKGEIIELVPVETLESEPLSSIFTSLVMIRPRGPRGIDAHELEQLMEKLPRELKIQDFVEEKPEDLGLYGLDSPNYELQLRDRERSLSFIVGTRDSIGNYYVRFGGEERVVTLAESDLAVLQMDSFLLMDKFPLIISIDKIDAFTVVHENETFSARIERNSSPDSDEPELRYILEGKEIDEKAFKKLYQKLVGIIGDAPNRGELPTAGPEFGITYRLADDPQGEASVWFKPVDKDFYAAFTDQDESFFLVASRQIKGAAELLRKMTGE